MLRSLFALILCLLLSCLVSAQEEGPTPYEIALQKIEQAREGHFSIILLDDLGLNEVPPEIGTLSEVRWIFLNGNRLQRLPPEIATLNLFGLVLYDNQLEEIPVEISKMPYLCFLSLRYNNLTNIPVEFANARELIQGTNCEPSMSGIELQGNPLTSPPAEVIEQGTAAILDYLRNPLFWHIRRYALYWAPGTGGILALFTALGWRLNRNRGKKKKH